MSSKGNRCKSAKKKDSPKITSTILLSSGVIAALITGGFSLQVSRETNVRLQSIETQKYEYELQTMRYEKLQEFLIFFSEFQVYDDELIYNFVVASEYSIDMIMKKSNESFNAFSAKLQQLNAYLSDQALELLETKADEIKETLLDDRTIDVTKLDSVDQINLAVKNHMALVNSDMSKVSSFLVQVITQDIFYEYFSNSSGY